MEREELTCALVVETFQKDFGSHYLLNDSSHRQSHFRQVERDGKMMSSSSVVDYHW